MVDSFITANDTSSMKSDATPEASVSTDEFSKRLATAAFTDQRLKALIKSVASGDADVAEMKEFQQRLDALMIAEPPLQPLEGDHEKRKHASEYTQPFLDFINENPTVFHTVQYFESKLHKAGYVKLSERANWASGKVKLERGGKYFVTRNGSSLIAFVVGEKYKVGENGVGMVVGHIDALTARGKFMFTHRFAFHTNLVFSQNQ